MTKKNYEKFAEILEKFHPDHYFKDEAGNLKPMTFMNYHDALTSYRLLIHKLCDYFGEDNMLFNRVKFINKVYDRKEW